MELSFRCDLILLNLDLYLQTGHGIVTAVLSVDSVKPMVDLIATSADSFFLNFILVRMCVHLLRTWLSLCPGPGHSRSMVWGFSRAGFSCLRVFSLGAHKAFHK